MPGLFQGPSMAKKPQKDDYGDERSAEETERIRDATLKKLISTPPKPFTKKAKEKRDAIKKR